MKPFRFLNIAQDSECMDIYLNGEIVDSDIKWLYDYFDVESTSPKSFKAMLDEANGKPLNIHINSIGGDVFAGFAMYSLIKNHKGKTTAYIDSVCASAATLPAVACDHVVMQVASTMMIHCVSMCTGGNKKEFQKGFETLDSLDKSLANAYEEKTGRTREELLALMEAETWMDAKKAKELGFIDEISGHAEIPQEVMKDIIDNNKRIVACLRKGEQPKDLEPALADTSSEVGSTLLGGKFANVEELEKAYSSLQSEYTKKCQQLAKAKKEPERNQGDSLDVIKARFALAKIKNKL